MTVTVERHSGHPLLWVTYWVTYETDGSLEKACKLMIVLGISWSGREDLNLRPPGPEPGALPG
jgi:hypothetical protein